MGIAPLLYLCVQFLCIKMLYFPSFKKLSLSSSSLLWLHSKFFQKVTLDFRLIFIITNSFVRMFENKFMTLGPWNCLNENSSWRLKKFLLLLSLWRLCSPLRISFKMVQFLSNSFSFLSDLSVLYSSYL